MRYLPRVTLQTLRRQAHQVERLERAPAKYLRRESSPLVPIRVAGLRVQRFRVYRVWGLRVTGLGLLKVRCLEARGLGVSRRIGSPPLVPVPCLSWGIWVLRVLRILLPALSSRCRQRFSAFGLLGRDSFPHRAFTEKC